MDSIISAQGLSKRYRLGASATNDRTLREVIVDKTRSWFGSDAPANGNGADKRFFWALRDVSFDIQRGDVVGIIGKNGAGKSTLLKLLSRITDPTQGRAEIVGRVGSLLEVGTGFHPELTGRENIFLNGTLMGMSRREVATKFDAIVEFAEVERFLDTPVKRYSSGMYVRLAFAVAAHLEPDVLIVDEVLAVGDMAFQRKCLGKVQDVATHGNTVLFVSHNMGAVTSLCTRAILLERGSVVLDGTVNEVVDRYMTGTANQAQTPGRITYQPLPADDRDGQVLAMTSLDHAGRACENTLFTDGFSVELEYVLHRRVPDLEVSIDVFDRNGAKVFYSSTRRPPTGDTFEPGRYRSRVRIPGKFLIPNHYWISAAMLVPNVRFVDQRERAVSVQIVDNGSDLHRFAGTDVGSVWVDLEWGTTRE
ncbi:MAG: ABC transporter ATP-binding protein [Planctomycetes bacterium]|nr:ABC transporter ATP-binding protein [Planctomycetota bacterium]